MNDRKKILVLGTGNFGTALAQHLAVQGNEVILWGRQPEVVKLINRDHRNPQYLSSFELSANITATLDPPMDLWATIYAIVIAVPCQNMREAICAIPKSLNRSCLMICAVKGIENHTQALPSQIIQQYFSGNPIVVLSGPSFAVEVIQNQPTCVSLASSSVEAALAAQELFHAPTFRSYTSNDPMGLEVAGALKNVIAIAAGACEGLGYENNARAALLTRGLAEITRVGVAFGANPLTFTGLGGVGDLFLTCTSLKSRNFQVGYQLGKGAKLKTIQHDMTSVAEGVLTAPAAKAVAAKLGIEAPIINEVYAVLYEQKPIADAVQTLLNREAKPELTLP